MTETPAQSIPVFPADALRVTNGVNLGDAMSVLDDIELDDVYLLSSGARMQRLSLNPVETGGYVITVETEAGRPGNELHIDGVVTVMSDRGELAEIVVLAEVAEGHLNSTYLLPLSPLHARMDYVLVGVDRSSARRKFAQIACVSFTRGTHIALSTGRQVPIEDLQIGDKVMTRDSGAQPVRWVGHGTVRATGRFAPIVIKAGTLNNEHDLVVSPDHRLFVYQRTDQIGTGRPELLIKARHLVNGDTVFVQEGGFVEYFQLLFDRHHLIYAEGIAAESMLIDQRTRPALPPELIERLRDILPDHAGHSPHGLDVQKALLDRPDAIELLRKASMH